MPTDPTKFQADPQADPVDPDRPRHVSPGATHVVTFNAVGPSFVRGDMIGPDDLPNGQAGVDRLVGLDAVRPLTAEELKSVPGRAPAKKLTDPPK